MVDEIPSIDIDVLFQKKKRETAKQRQFFFNELELNNFILDLKEGRLNWKKCLKIG